MVEIVDETRRRHARRDRGEAHEIAEQYGHVLDAIGDHDLAVVQPADDLPGQDVVEEGV